MNRKNIAKRNILLTTAITAIACCTTKAQNTTNVPRLVVNITIDQMRTDLLLKYQPSYNSQGFRELIGNGIFFTDAKLNFSQADLASSIAYISTGATPRYNGIIGRKWFDRNDRRTVSCIEDSSREGIFTSDNTSPAKIQVTTVSDELKADNDKSIIISIGEDAEAAIIHGGHNADGAYWIDRKSGKWCSSDYYPVSKKDLYQYNSNCKNSQRGPYSNDGITDFAMHCIDTSRLGEDNITDILHITYKANDNKADKSRSQDIYLNLDKNITRLIDKISSRIGKDKVLFVISSTGYTDTDGKEHDNKIRIPGGTFYINRTSNLLNLYLSAFYGNDKYIDGYYHNQIYLDTKLLDKKRLRISEVTDLAKTFVRQCQGVADCLSTNDLLSYSSPELQYETNSHNLRNSGDLTIRILPGWTVANEDNGETFTNSTYCFQFPLILYGLGLKGERITSPTPLGRIPATISKVIKIRAPNACKEESLL